MLSTPDGPAPLAALLLDPSRTVAGGDAVRQGVAVYRNNVAAALVGALEDSFPVCRSLVGDRFFAATALEFARAHPPRSPDLSLYGEEFGDFLSSFPPAAPLPYLPDVARLERRVLDAFNAADQAPPSSQSQVLPPVSLDRHPFAVGSIWLDHHGRSPAENLDVDRPENVLVWRRDQTIFVAPIDDAAAEFVALLLEQVALDLALEAVAKRHPTFGTDRWSAFASAELLQGAAHIPHPIQRRNST